MADNLIFLQNSSGYYNVENSVSPAGIYVTDKTSGQQFAAGTTNYSIKSIPAIK